MADDPLIKPMHPEAWDERYRTGNTGWDLGQAPPPLQRLLEAVLTPGLRVLVPGAGYGNDAIAWAQAGHQVVTVDFAPSAVAGAAQRAREKGVTMTTLLADLFELPQDLDSSFDVVWEQTCFCAIPPDRRSDYATVVARVLAPSGHLYGLFWNHQRAGGPPFDISREMVRSTFKPLFDVVSLETVRISVPKRQNQEFLATLRRRAQ